MNQTASPHASPAQAETLKPGGPWWADPRPAAWVERLARWALAVVFLWAGITKLMAPRAFAVILSRYGMVPEPLLAPAAIGLPLLETAAGIGLIWDVRGGLEVVTGLLVMFIVVLWFGVLQGLDVDCGCFSPDELAEHGGLKSALYRDFGYLAGAAYLYWRRWRRAGWRGLIGGSNARRADK